VISVATLMTTLMTILMTLTGSPRWHTTQDGAAKPPRPTTTLNTGRCGKAPPPKHAPTDTAHATRAVGADMK
jgi:hypothetical protein